ncbi:MAG TPA: hypothetical protein VNI55_11375 [Gaiellaceae bacterium]|nr:hypothetical protein [Gaiellaceae bacterium]
MARRDESLEELPCEVCGAAAITVRQSRLPLPVSCGYCESCDQLRLEPHSVIEAFLAVQHELDDRAAGEPELAPKSVTDEIVRRSLAFHSR